MQAICIPRVVGLIEQAGIEFVGCNLDSAAHCGLSGPARRPNNLVPLL